MLSFLLALQLIGWSPSTLLSPALRLPGRQARVAVLTAVLTPPPEDLGQPPSEDLDQALPEELGVSGFASGRVEPQRPQRRKRSMAMPPQSEEDGGFVFGEASVLRARDALRNGSLVLLSEDGDADTSISVLLAPGLAQPAQIDFLLEHAIRPQVALEPAAYRDVYGSMHKIVLDNNNLEHPALSVSIRGEKGSPLNSTHVARTLHELVAREPQSEGLTCPGAVSLACGREGGVLVRAGATEASIKLARLAGLAPAGMHATLRVTGIEALRSYAQRWGLAYSSTADLVAYERRRAQLVERCGPPARMPTKFGLFTAHCYRSLVDGVEHIALVKDGREDGRLDPRSDELGESDFDELKPFAASAKPALVRVHSECCTGDIFGSLRCDCGPQLEAAMQAIQSDGWGVLLYLRGQEGRGIGLGAKIHAYSLQERGLDTLDANVELGLPVDSREYGTGAQILVDLGIRDMRLISNNPKKFTGLRGYGLRITDREASHIEPHPGGPTATRPSFPSSHHPHPSRPHSTLSGPSCSSTPPASACRCPSH